MCVYKWVVLYLYVCVWYIICMGDICVHVCVECMCGMLAWCVVCLCVVCVCVCIVCVCVCGGGTDSGLHAVCDITPKLVQAVPTMAASFPCFHLQQASQSSSLFTPFAPKPLVICPFDYHHCLVCDLASPRLRFLWIISKFRLCQNCVFWGCKERIPVKTGLGLLPLAVWL